MRTYVGILGDPAKLEAYPNEFYEILNYDESNFVFHLIGASERDVNRNDVNRMYQLFENNLKHKKIQPLSIFPQGIKKNLFSNRIGLFPSQRNQVIHGPNFIFAPYPINSKSNLLKFRSKITIKLYNKLTAHNVLPVAYCPIGGKAANRIHSDMINESHLENQFYRVRRNKWFKWFYLEAGSGENKLDHQLIQKILQAQFQAITHTNVFPNKWKSENRILVPRAIYGGGIRNISHIDSLLDKSNDLTYIPECVILGNISEQDISMTYKIIDRINELND